MFSWFKRKDHQSGFTIKVKTSPSHNASKGVTDERKAICPNCQSALAKIPGAKTKCPHCKQDMFVRTHPRTRTRQVVTAAQAEEIDDEIARINGTWELRKAEKLRTARTKETLQKKFGGIEPSKEDIQWSLLQQDLTNALRKRDWYDYMIIKSNMGDAAAKRGKSLVALDAFLEVAFLVINGAQDFSPALEDSQFARVLDLKEFAPDKSERPIWNLNEIKALIAEQHMSLEEVNERFTKRTKNYVQTPIASARAWEILASDLTQNNK